MKKFYLFVLLVGVIFSLSNCSNEKFIPDVSDIQLETKIARFERDLFAIDTNNLSAEVNQLKIEYGAFLSRIYANVMKDESIANESIDALILRILQSPSVHSLNDSCQMVFKDISKIESDLNLAFKYYKYYFPDREVPKVVSYISEYGLGNFTYGDSLVGIGWDFFLGQNYPNYNINYFPEFVQRTMNPENVVPKLIHAVSSNLAGELKGRRLLDQMIHNGKALYLKSLLLPNMSDSLIMEYGSREIEWVESNEFQMWAHFLKEDLIYSTKMKEIRKLINASPNGPGGMPPETPGRVANWVGWQIIKTYMENNPKISLQSMIEEKDAQKILNKAKYKPKR